MSRIHTCLPKPTKRRLHTREVARYCPALQVDSLSEFSHNGYTYSRFGDDHWHADRDGHLRSDRRLARRNT